MLKQPRNADEAMVVTRNAIKSIVGRRENAKWHHGHVNGLISAFALVGLFEQKHIRTMNCEADEALERVTHADIPRQDI
ncbi:hypothetical protein [Pseudomonas lactis]|uniref:hypothetical protein n=1 Tax=Pseudomonas lactis TaxID=1615674 RepID=UPI001A007AEC|nr:hypothetical protein [Pseudomonas lactis]MBA6043572.1 hypothetical protein [Pseudomonas lactis]